MKQIHIGTIIAEKRKQRGLTQQALAEHVGISKPAVSKWESGQAQPEPPLDIPSRCWRGMYAWARPMGY